MTPLFELLGRNVTSPEAVKALAGFPALRPEVDDATDEEAEPMRYLASESDGLLIKLSADGDILTVFLMSEGKDGFSQYHGEMPGGLTFASGRKQALQAFGPPAYLRPAGKVGQFEVGELMRFDFPAWSLHIQFRADQRGIELVTAMVAAAVPGRSVRGVELP